MNARDLANEEILNTQDRLVKFIDDPVTRITLADFEERAIPLLRNVGENFDVTSWLEITSHPQVRLEVVDTAGEVIYSIPPFHSKHKSHNCHGVDNISAAANHFTLLRSSSPMQALNILHSELSNYKNKDEEYTQDLDETVQVLTKIFTDYNIDKKLGTVEVKDTPKQSTSKLATIDDGDDFDFL